MEQKIIGYRYLTGTSKRTGEPFRAYVLSLVSDDVQQGSHGQYAENVFVNGDLLEKAFGKGVDVSNLVGSSVSLGYNRNGYLQDVRLYAPAK